MARRRESRSPLEGKASTEQNETCVICTELMLDIRRGVLPCGHEYCAECIKSWAACSNTCPLCKAPFRTISEHTASGRKKRVRVDNAELEVSYGPEEFAEEMYGDAQYDEEAEAAEQNMLLGVNFVGFGLSHYNEAEDSSFASSDAQSNSDELALEDDDDEDDDDDDDEDEDDDDDDDDNDEDEGSSSLPSIVGASGGDALAHVWNSRRDSNFADSSSATPVAPRRTRRGVGNRRRAPPSPPMRLRSRQNQPVDIDDNDDDDDDDDDEDFEDDDDDVVLSPRPRRQTAAYNMAPPPRREPPRPGNRGNDSRAMDGRRVQPQRRAAATRAERQRASSPPAPSPGVDIDLVSNETPVAGRRGLRQRNRGGSPSSDVDLDLFTPN